LIQVPRSNVTKDLSSLVCYDVCLCKETYQLTLNTKALRLFEMSGTVYQTTKRKVPNILYIILGYCVYVLQWKKLPFSGVIGYFVNLASICTFRSILDHSFILK